jgi:archaemetzincin
MIPIAMKCVLYILFIGAILSQEADTVADSAFIVPIGGIDKALLDELAMLLYKRFNIPFVIKAPIEIPQDAFDVRRNQYNATMVLEKLYCYKAKRVLGIIDKDLYVSGLNFVFGQADLKGSYAIISIIRLRQEFYGLLKDDKVFFERVIKEAVHELGHTYGLNHCSNPKCVMFFSNSLLDTDRKSSYFCDSCLRKINAK